jgi:protein-L-isoaspartate(D-aspartate) O-methyltransferase
MAGRHHEQTRAELEAARADMVRDIGKKVWRHGTGTGEREVDARVLDAIGRIPREKFVPMMEAADAYANRPLPIGHRQTISQPLIVALMTHHLRLVPDHKVLEIGTGSGYQTAVLAELASTIVTVENVAALAAEAKARLADLGYRHVRFVEGDGRDGCPDQAPFDRIIVTAAAVAIPPALLDQLAPNGRLVLPIGSEGGQHLVLVTSNEKGKTRERRLFPVGFVPLTYGRG